MEVSLVLVATGKSGENKAALAGRGRAPDTTFGDARKEESRGPPNAVHEALYPLAFQAAPNELQPGLNQRKRCAFEAIKTELAFFSDFCSEFLLSADKQIGS